MTLHTAPKTVSLSDDPVAITAPRWAVSVAVFLVTAVVGMGIWLFAPSDHSEIQPPADLASFDYVDGVLSQVELPVLVMNAYEPVDGETTLTFRVPDENLRYFDVVHLRAHSSIGLPTRVFFEVQGDELIAVYKIDAPANSGGSE
jgi:hypothetical protein